MEGNDSERWNGRSIAVEVDWVEELWERPLMARSNNRASIGGQEMESSDQKGSRLVYIIIITSYNYRELYSIVYQLGL